MNFKIREANVNDAEEIATVYVRSWKESFYSLIDPEYLTNLTAKSRTDVWRGIIDKKFCHTLVVEDENSSIIGFISGGKFRSKKSCDSEIYAIYLLKPYQGQGIGTKLRNDLSRILMKEGYKSLCIWVFKEITNNRYFFTNGSVKIEEDDIKIGNEKITQECFYWKDMKEFFRKDNEETKLTFFKLDKLQSLFH
jgi:L-amino acid N-acyltransferase YncA